MSHATCLRCGAELPPCGRGRPRVYCTDCRPIREAARQALSAGADEREPDDDPPTVIEAKFRAAQRAVRGTLPLDPWAITSPRIPHREELGE